MATDLMGIGYPKDFQPYTRDDGWTVVLPGEESSRGNKVVVATSDVEIKLASKEDVQKCIKILEESDRRLKLIASNPWNWAPAMYKDNTVKFGVAWYDMDFFNQRKDAWSGKEHTSYYLQFSSKPEDFKVKHRILKKSKSKKPPNPSSI